MHGTALLLLRRRRQCLQYIPMLTCPPARDKFEICVVRLGGIIVLRKLHKLNGAPMSDINPIYFKS